MKSLSDWLDHIAANHPETMDLGLERVSDVAGRLGVTDHGGQTLIVAGTNGKGSTCVFAEHLLRAGGKTVGTTLSPHLERFNERIRVDGCAVDDSVICEAFARVEAARLDVTLTYFEFAVLAALCVFQRTRVDVRVLEVGLGGRLDAVNVCERDVSVITNVGLDHQSYLGHNRESIGTEKAGIVRAGVPVVLGERCPPRSVLDAAAALGTPVYRLGNAFSFERRNVGWSLCAALPSAEVQWRDLPLPQVAPVNAATAIVAVALLGDGLDRDHVVCAAALPGLPGRLELVERRGLRVVMDVAHNPAGAEFLAGQLKARGLHIETAVAGFLQDKDVAGIVAALDGVVGRWLFVDTRGDRGQSAATSLGKSGLTLERGSVSTGMDSALAERSESKRGGVTLVVGSFDVVDQARRCLDVA